MDVERRDCPSCGERSRIITRGDSRATVVSACCETVLPEENDEPTVHVEDDKLICPYGDCGAVDEIVELDVATRTNELTIEGPGLIKAGLGDGSFEHDGYECQQCTRPVSLPDNYEVISA